MSDCHMAHAGECRALHRRTDSMDIAAAVGAERLREIMIDVVDRAAVVVQHFGGTVGSFTGDGIMAVFGAPAALEDHAIRACLAALGVQEQAKRLAVDVQDRDGVELQLRIGLNSGRRYRASAAAPAILIARADTHWATGVGTDSRSTHRRSTRVV